jgi:hypothetical protein
MGTAYAIACINNQLIFDTSARRSEVPGFPHFAVADFAGVF